MIFPLLVLGRPGENCILSGDAIGPITVRTCATSFFLRSSDAWKPSLSVTYTYMPSFTFDVVRITDDCGLCNRLVSHQGRLYLGRAEPMTRDINNGVDPSHEPIIAVIVKAGTVAGEVLMLVEKFCFRLTLPKPCQNAPRLAGCPTIIETKANWRMTRNAEYTTGPSALSIASSGKASAAQGGRCRPSAALLFPSGSPISFSDLLLNRQG